MVSTEKLKNFPWSIAFFIQFVELALSVD